MTLRIRRSCMTHCADALHMLQMVPYKIVRANNGDAWVEVSLVRKSLRMKIPACKALCPSLPRHSFVHGCDAHSIIQRQLESCTDGVLISLRAR